MSKRRQTRTPVSSYGSAWLWYFCGIVSGLLIATFALQSGWIHTPSTLQVVDQQSTDDESQGIAAGDELVERQYDFFRVLPEQDHIISPRELEQDRRAPSSETITAPGSYSLQVGSFRSETDADTLRANLVLLGVNVRVIPVTVNDTTWHRVRVGPLNSATEADEVRLRLETSGYQTLVLKEQ